MESELNTRQQAYVAAVERGCKGMEAVSPGFCPSCPECIDALGYTDDEDEDGSVIKTAQQKAEEDYETGKVCDEGGFSWSACDCCGSRLGGNRNSAHGWADIAGKRILIHFEICDDCMLYLANGDIPDDQHLKEFDD